MDGKVLSNYREKEVMRRHLLASVLYSTGPGVAREAQRSLTAIVQGWFKKQH